MVELTSARDEILARIRAGLRAAQDELAREGEHEQHPPTPAHPAPGAEPDRGSGPVARFRSVLERVGGAVYLASDEEGLVARLAALVAERGVRTLALSDAPLVRRVAERVRERAPGLVLLDARAPREELLRADLGLTGAQAGIAETGTLVLVSDDERHRLASLLPPVHVAVLERGDLLPDLDHALARVFRGDVARLARCVTFVTGPSRTADIELQLVVGVHGPRELHVLILGDS
jgi:L-lactate dehydrogenase complex protein LldG